MLIQSLKYKKIELQEKFKFRPAIFIYIKTLSNEKKNHTHTHTPFISEINLTFSDAVTVKFVNIWNYWLAPVFTKEFIRKNKLLLF